MAGIPTDFIIPGTFLTESGTGSAVSSNYTIILLSTTTAVTAGSGVTFNISATGSGDDYTVSGVTIAAGGSGYHYGDSFSVGNIGTVTATSVSNTGAVLTVSFDSTTVYTTDPTASAVAPKSTTTITAPVNTLVYAADINTVNSTFGSDSTIAQMYQRYVAVDTVTTVYLLTAASTEVSDLNTALAVVEETPFNAIYSDFNTSDHIGAFHTFFTTRWGYASELFATHYTSKTDTAANLIEFGGTVNSQYSTVYSFAVGSKDSDSLKIAAIGSVVAPQQSSDPAQPIQLMLLNVAASGNGFSISERNALFNAGLAITKENSAGEVYLERSRTTYQTNAAGTADDTYQSSETLPTLAVIATAFREKLNSQFFSTGMKLIATDPTSSVSNRNIATPASIKAALITIYNGFITSGYCSDAATFNSGVTVSVPSTGVVSCFVPITLVEQLRQIQINLGFTI